MDVVDCDSGDGDADAGLAALVDGLTATAEVAVTAPYRLMGHSSVVEPRMRAQHSWEVVEYVIAAAAVATDAVVLVATVV